MKIKHAIPENQLDPELMSICINLNIFPYSVSASRQYMLGNNAGKSVRIRGATTRRLTSGFESEYGKYARGFKAPSNMIVEKIFRRRSENTQGMMDDDWTELYVVFFNEELQLYDLLVLPKTNTQNSYVAFDYIYDKEMLRRLYQPEATFRKGEQFARSPGVSETGEWMFGVEANVIGMTAEYTEEDGIGVVDDFLDTIATSFQHHREFSFMESEYVPLNLYGTLQDPRCVPEKGERIRDDGIVMGFRRRDDHSALVSMTKKGLMLPDETYDMLFYAPPNCTVSDVKITTERYKNRSHNKSVEKPVYSHSRILESYAESVNKMANEVKEWSLRLEARYRGADLPITPALFDFIFKQGHGEIVKDYHRDKYNQTKNAHRKKNKLDWNIEVTLSESVRGKKRFKLTDAFGAKGVIVKIIPAANAPRYPDGRRADIVINNTPAFRRQIYGSLMEAYVNLVNMDTFDKITQLVKQPKGYEKAWELLIKFYHAASLEFGVIAENALPTAEEREDHIDYILREGKISVHIRSDTKRWGIEIVRELKSKFPDVMPQHATYINDFGQTVTTLNPVVLSSMYYMLLNKFGTDISAISMPSRNLFGLPAKLSANDRYRNWHRAQPGRNKGEAEGRVRKHQVGGEENSRELIAATSPDVSLRIAQRIIRSDDPLNERELVRDSEMTKNRSLHMAMNMLNDAGYALCEEKDDDLIA